MNLDEFRAWAAPRCKEVPYLPEELPCLIWQGATINNGTQPRAVMHRGQPPVIVRREVWRIMYPGAPALGHDTPKPRCECPLCIEPTHLLRVSPSVYRSVPKSLAGRLNMQRAARASRSKVRQPEIIVPMVLADTRPAKTIARELGLGEDVIGDIRRGKWSTAGNPFAGLGAR